MKIRRRGVRRPLGAEGLHWNPIVEVTKSIRDDDGIDHEVTYRSRYGDGRFSYTVACGKRMIAMRRRWKEVPVNCMDCIAAEEPGAQ